MPDNFLDHLDPNAPQYNDLDIGLRPVTFQWYNADRRHQFGYFYCLEAQDDLSQPPRQPWKRTDSQTRDKSKPEYGYETYTLSIAPIALRIQPFVPKKGEGGQKERIWLDQYVRGIDAVFHSELLCLPQGFGGQEAVWTGAAMKSVAIEECLELFKYAWLRPARLWAARVGRPAPPSWAFRMTVTSDKEPDGTVKITRLKEGSEVTQPTVLLPRNLTGYTLDRLRRLTDEQIVQAVPAEELNQAFIGTVLFARGYEVRAKYGEWLKERRTSDLGLVGGTR